MILIDSHLPSRTPTGGPGAKIALPMQGGLGSIPVQGTRAHMPQVRVQMLRLKIPSAVVKLINLKKEDLAKIRNEKRGPHLKKKGFPGGSVVKNLPANVGDMGSIPGPGRSHMLRSN